MNALLRLGETVFPHFVDAAWKATALIPVVFALTRILGKKRPVARYWLWVYCVVGLLVLPIASFFVGEHGVPLLPASVPQAVSGHPAPSSEKTILTFDTSAKRDEGYRAEPSEVVPEEETDSAAPETMPSRPDVAGDIENPPEEISPPELSNLHSAEFKAMESLTTEDSSIASTRPEAKEESPPAAAPPPTQPVAARSRAPRASTFPWRGAIGLAWIVACAAMFVRLLFASAALARLRRSSRPVSDAALLRLFDEVKQSSGFTAQVQLRTGTQVTSPVSVGILRPMILLPESLPDEMPADQLRPILLHELGHVRWRDHAVNLVQRLLEAVFFFHPFVHLLNRHLRSLREEICDVWVMSHCKSATLYARALTALAERWLARGGNPIGVGLFNHRVHLPERIRRILSLGKTLPATLRLRTAILLLAISLLAVAGLSLLSLSAREAKAEGEKVAREEKTTASAAASEKIAITWKNDAVYRDGKTYAKIVQWEPEADLPMVAFGDQNNNGKTDIWIRFLNGKPLRIEIDSNEDGRIDKWEHYFDGVIDLVEVDTDFNRKVDLWQVYDNGKLFREEIDLSADGSVDKWLEVDEKGKLVEKEIFSWTATVKLMTSSVLGYPERAIGQATFFNARERVQAVEKEAEAPESRKGYATSTKNMTDPIPLRHWSPTGSRIETTTEIEGRNIISAWHHMALWGNRLPEMTKAMAFVVVRHSAVDRSLDGGVDSWEQSDLRLFGIQRDVYPDTELLSGIECDDRNRDGKADRWEINTQPNPATRLVEEFVENTDSNADGLLDEYSRERGLFFRIDSDRDGVFDSFPKGWEMPYGAELLGSSVLRLNPEVRAEREPLPLLCELKMHPVGRYSYQRSFWLFPGEVADVAKMPGGTYDLTVEVLRAEVEPRDRSIPGSTGREQRTSRFFYPSFISIPKGEVVLRSLPFDTRPVFRGRLIANDLKPVADGRLTVSFTNPPLAWAEVTSDRAGDFELFNVPQGEYVLSGSVGSSPSDRKGFKQAIRIAAASEEAPEPVVIAVPFTIGTQWLKPPLDWKAPLALFGKVLSQEGEPLPNMRLVITPPDGQPGTAEGSPVAPPSYKESVGVRREVVTGLDGSYRVLALPPGTYEVSIYNNDFRYSQPVERITMQIEKTPMEKDFRLSGPLLPAGQ